MTPTRKRKIVKARVRRHLLKGKSITHAECQAWFKGSRLSSIVNRLQKEMKIVGKMIYEKDGSQYKRYWWEKPVRVSRVKGMYSKQ